MKKFDKKRRYSTNYKKIEYVLKINLMERNVCDKNSYLNSRICLIFEGYPCIFKHIIIIYYTKLNTFNFIIKFYM